MGIEEGGVDVTCEENLRRSRSSLDIEGSFIADRCRGTGAETPCILDGNGGTGILVSSVCDLNVPREEERTAFAVEGRLGVFMDDRIGEGRSGWDFLCPGR